ncbi:molecular chaperone [Cupriavidus metallidurans]|uniref:Chaperone protein TorD n=1 Tax=Cupriavidus metallidurans TaxID=119219 RepID=A0A482IVV2_9BURK|nr:molecular chaperone TorD family protein [Cupriavidus metallidurans]QBP12531.1 hypothetical protein DDF84_022695 [Cupriavidus metallidurans]
MIEFANTAPAPDLEDVAFVADWLAQQFLEPPDAARILAIQGIQGQVAVHWIGSVLAQEEAADAICRTLNADTPEALAASLQRRHTQLFEGIFRQRSLPPYASIWDGTGHLFGAAIDRTQESLRALNVHIDSSCPEPADHISIQLVALAESLRQAQLGPAGALLANLRAWMPRFATALIQLDGDGFHGQLGRLLIALPDRVASLALSKVGLTASNDVERA